jgi:hypothetical protein
MTKHNDCKHNVYEHNDSKHDDYKRNDSKHKSILVITTISIALLYKMTLSRTTLSKANQHNDTQYLLLFCLKSNMLTIF